MALTAPRLPDRRSVRAGRPGAATVIVAALLVGAGIAAGQAGWLLAPAAIQILPAGLNPSIAPVSPLPGTGSYTREIRVVATYPDGATTEDITGPDAEQPAADAVGRLLDEIETHVYRPSTEAQLRIGPGGTVDVVPGQSGWRLDREATRRNLLDAITVVRPDEAITLPAALVEVPPPAGDVDHLRSELDRRLREPMVLRIGDESLPIPANEWLPALIDQTYRPADPIRIDRDRLRPVLDALAVRYRRPPVNARLEIRDGRLQVLTSAVAGREARVEALIDEIERRVGSPDRTIEVPLHEVQPAVRPETIGQLGIREWLGEGITPYDLAEGDRSFNIELAARHLHGLVIAPGEVFSFNRAVGPTTTANGYRWGWGIATTAAGPRMVPSEAGGICQAATTLVQAAYWAGLEIVERHPHSFWIQKYGVSPVARRGLDAAVDESGGADLRFRNTTDRYLLIQASVREDGLHIQLFGTNPGWRVEVGQPVITNQVKPDYAVVRQPTDRLPLGREMWLETAGEGFRARLTRTVTDATGTIVRRDTLDSTYAASRNVLGVGTGPAN
ncbi:MAG TPA: VanW family protein [Dehalococcoidia bacterium]|nr:VanW family protein [Dehalococcoidia bacterium]